MNIFFDHTVFSRAPYSGVSRYICRLAEALCAIDGVESEIAAFFTNNRLLVETDVPKIAWPVPAIPRFGRLAPPINDRITNAYLRGRRYDVLHHSLYNTSIDRRPFRAVIGTSHDMIHELRPDLYAGADMAAKKAAVLGRCDRVIAISESTRRDMVERFGYDDDRIVVVHHGVEPPLPFVPQRLYTSPYVLFVGARGGYKNFATLVEAMARLPTALSDLRLVAFGGGPLTGDEKAMIDRLGLAGRVVGASGGDTALAQHYAHAEAFVCPSGYEGFGMPLLEAMSYGCPVISSNTSSLPEVGGDAAAYFDPLDADALAEVMARVVGSAETRDGMTTAGRERAAMFTWDKCARETLAVYHSVTEGGQ